MSLFQISIRRGTLAEWQTANPVLLRGELGLIAKPIGAGIDFHKVIVMGDGQSDFNTLYSDMSNWIPSWSTVILDLLPNQLAPIIQSIQNEITARTSADTTLQNHINTEASTRASADSAMAGDITTLQSLVDGINAFLSSGLADMYQSIYDTNNDGIVNQADYANYADAAGTVAWSGVTGAPIGSPNGIAELDSTGKVPATQLPSYVDDVEEYATALAFPVAGESGKIYVALSDNTTWRWSGSIYVQLNAGLTLGETSATAYRGDRGKAAYDHSLITGNPHGTTKSDVGLGSVDNTSDANKPVSTAQATAIALRLLASANLSDLADIVTARTNLGLGTSSTKNVGTSSGTVMAGDDSRIIKTAQSSWKFRTADGATLYSSQPYAGNYGTLSIGASQSIRYMPLIVDPDSVIIKLLGLYVIAAAGAGNKARLGIYNSSGSFRPSSLVVDAGEVAVDSVGQKSITGLTTNLSRGLYFLAMANQIGFSMDSILAASYPDIFGTSTGSANPVTYFVETRAYGALPANAGTLSNQIGNSPAVFFAFQ